jgi:WD40 repeat protein
MSLFGGVLLWMLIPRSRQSLSALFQAKSVAIAASALVVISATGFISTERHLRGQFDNYNARITVTPGGLLASDPTLTSSGVLFTSMTPTGYTIRRLRDGRAEGMRGLDGDWFHPTAAGDDTSLWAEQSTRNGSRVVRLALDATGQQSVLTINATEVEDAEQPVASPDGQFLAFLRPVKGQNSLWVQKIAPTSATREESGTAQLTEIASEEYDVHEAAFLPDSRLIFSAKQNGRFRLFVATQSDKIEIEELNKPSCSVRYPAISPDGQWIAFSCEEGSAANIHVADLDGTRGLGEKDLQITSADCNSISPAWTADSKRLVYATDCGRGLGLTALAQATVFP